MIKSLLARIKQGYHTTKFPDGSLPELPDRFIGKPVVDCCRCSAECKICADVCPVGAISFSGGLNIDLGKCIFCGECKDSCPVGAIDFEQNYQLYSGSRKGLIINNAIVSELGEILRQDIIKIFGRSLKLRQVCAGGCGACEADINVLSTIGWDLGRFGIQFVASPRHADGIVITGPVTQNMKLALEKTYEAIPHPKVVILVGACAISGGIYENHPETNNGADELFPVDLYIPGCPPHPLTILSGLISLTSASFTL